MLEDQRSMLGAGTVEEVRDRWVEILAQINAKRAEYRQPPLELHDEPTKLDAYVNHGRWLADCPCGGGIPAWPEHKKGACLDCGGVYTIRFPKQAEIEQASEVLAQRPARRRNWYPRCETVGLLKAENELLLGVIG